MRKRIIRKQHYRVSPSGSIVKPTTDLSRHKKVLVKPVYIGPTVDGPDAEYTKVVSGKVDNRKPSFV